MASSKTLYILYNADASVMGKLRYGYKKLTAGKECEPTCAACDITHGGISLNESAEWVAAKKDVETDSGVKVVQWHRDEIAPPLLSFIKEKNLRYPAVVLDRGDDAFVEVMDGSELAGFKGSAVQFAAALKDKLKQI